MGLDVYAFSKLSPATTNEDASKFYDNPDFPGRAEGVDCTLYYDLDEAESFDVLSISYGGYYGWRNWLAEQLGYSPESEAGHPPAAYFGMIHQAEDGAPFLELVHFTDCEGTIGPVVSKKLAADFDAFADKVQGTERQMKIYDDFRKGFHLAADGGAVKFC